MEIDGKSPVLDAIDRLRRVHPSDFKKLLKTARYVTSLDRVTNEDHVKCDREKKVYEMRGGQARLFFFYTPDEKEVVVCTNHYWKAKPSKKEQNAAFEKCRHMRDMYLKDEDRSKPLQGRKP